jgi:hypothetical protein
MSMLELVTVLHNETAKGSLCVLHLLVHAVYTRYTRCRTLASLLLERLVTMIALSSNSLIELHEDQNTR